GTNLGQSKKMSRAQDERTVFDREFADSLGNFHTLGGHALQLLDNAARAIQRSFYFRRDLGRRWLASRHVRCFFFYLFERVYLLKDFTDDLLFFVLIERRAPLDLRLHRLQRFA